MNRRQFAAAAASATLAAAAVRASDNEDVEAAVRLVVQRYVEAREARDAASIEPLFTADADQLVSNGTWRRGRDVLVQGMLESSRENPAKRSIEVQSVRLLADDVALADGRYVHEAQPGTEGQNRQMWTSITLKRGADGWRIAAIRNMLPAPAG